MGPHCQFSGIHMNFNQSKIVENRVLEWVLLALLMFLLYHSNRNNLGEYITVIVLKTKPKWQVKFLSNLDISLLLNILYKSQDPIPSNVSLGMLTPPDNFYCWIESSHEVDQLYKISYKSKTTLYSTTPLYFNI